MKENMLPVTPAEVIPLSQDLDKIFKSILSQPDHILSDFSRESRNPVMMPDRSSFVLDLDTEQIINIFNVKEHHYFPEPGHVLRIGLAANLGYYNLLALVLKAMWEKHLYNLVKAGSDVPVQYIEVMTNEELIFEHTSSFQPETARIFNLLKSFDHLALLHRESFDSLEITIREMILNKYHLIDNQFLNRFATRIIAENEQKKCQDEDSKEEFNRNKMIFLRNHGTIETLLFDQMKISKESDNLKTRYYQRFPFKNEFLELLFRRDLLKIKIGIKKENPELSENELSVKTEQISAEFYKKLVDIQTAIKRASYARKGSGEQIDSMMEASYLNQVRKSLRTAFLLLHPDMIDKSVAEKLSEFQRTQLKQLWIELMEMKDTFSYDESMLLYYLPDISDIQRIIEKAKSILNYGDVEINPEYLIQGDTFSKKIEFLKNQNKMLNEHIISLQLRIQILLHDEEFQLYSNILSFQENVEKHELDLKNGIEAFKAEILTLQKQLTRCFNS